MKIGTPENKELAFRVYCRFGGRNVPEVLDVLRKEHGLKLSGQTLYRWKREGDWQERIERSEPSVEERRFLNLLGLIEKLERHLREAPGFDPQASYAYAGLLNTFFRLAKTVRPALRKDRDEMRRVAEEILEAEYGIKRDAAVQGAEKV